jgi:hypothetical protein
VIDAHQSGGDDPESINITAQGYEIVEIALPKN